jgi:uncharacterized protein (DUF885 family)
VRGPQRAPICNCARERSKRKCAWIILAAIVLQGSIASALNAAQNAEDEKLNSFFKSYLEVHLRQRPVEATRLGDHRFDNQVDDISREARDSWLALTRKTLKELPRNVDYAKLSRDGQIDFEILRHALETSEWLTENTHPFQEDPRVYGAYISDGVYLLLTQSTQPKETNIANSIARIMEIPRIVAVAKSTLSHPPKPILETAIRQNRGAISFYQKEIFQLAGDTTQLSQFKSAAAHAVVTLEDYQKFLEGDLIARADGDWRLGEKKFRRKLELELNAGLTADQVLADARSEFDHVREAMYITARQLWSGCFPGTALPPDDPAGRHDTITRVINSVNQDHARPEDLVTDARKTVEQIKKFIGDRDYLRLPNSDRCQVIEMPEFRRGNSAAYLESAPPLDPQAASYYAVSPPPSEWSAKQADSFLEEYNRHMLQILTIHEGYPGHYVQLEYANRQPSLIRHVFQSGPYVEGWAVYGEQTMLNEGYGNGDLHLRLMQLKFYLRAVANAILDHNMHCTKITDDEAMKFLTDEVFQSEGEARLKIIRAKQSSTQLSTYFVGRMAFYRLRQQIEREQGGKFDLGRYHEAVLAPGSVPVKYLPELARARLSEPR